MSIPRENLPKYVIPLFIIWVVLCNIVIIIISSIWLVSNPDRLGNRPGLIYGIVLGINLSSLLLLIPMFTLKKIPRFLIPAIAWFIVVAVVNAILGLNLFLIFGIIQLAADIWFDFMLRKANP